MPASAGRLEPVCPVEEHPTAPGVEMFPSRLKEVLPELGRESAQGRWPARRHREGLKLLMPPWLRGPWHGKGIGRIIVLVLARKGSE